MPHLGIDSLERIFLHYGYERRDAFSYHPPADHFPRIFISELRVGVLSTEVRRIVRSYTDTLTSDMPTSIDLNDADAVDTRLHRPLWGSSTFADYALLREESEYATWTIYNRIFESTATARIARQ